VSLRLRNDDSGFALIEVVVSAALVALVAIGVFAGLDSAGATSGHERSRAQAGALAQQDIERLRAKGGPALKTLATQPQPFETQTKTAGPLTYTVRSTVKKVDESAVGGACAGASAAVSYLQIESSVDWAGRPSGVKAMKRVSLIPLPPQGGSLIVQIYDRNKAPLSGIPVSVNGGSAVTTNAAGCSEWDNLTPGTYTVSLTKAGYVSPDGQTTLTKTVGVSDGSTTTTSFDYDVGASLSISFWTKLGTTNIPATTPGAPASMDQLTLSHSSLSSPRRVGTADTWVNQLNTGLVFPFAAAYTVHPGTCTSMDGGNISSGWRYTLTATTGGATLGQPTGFSPPTGTAGIRLPSYDVTVGYRWGGGANNTTPRSGARVFLYRASDGTGCGAKPMQVQTTNASGKPPFPGAPFGTYTVCADWVETNGGRNPGTWKDLNVNALVLNSYTTPNLGTITIDSRSGGSNGSTPGACPATYP